MEKAYWLSRSKAALNSARNAAGSEARLIHYDLAGRYGLKALSADKRAALAGSLPPAIYPNSPSFNDADDA